VSSARYQRQAAVFFPSESREAQPGHANARRERFNWLAVTFESKRLSAVE
jgi:hypothetical protein